jgi:hypothetical protein
MAAGLESSAGLETSHSERSFDLRVLMGLISDLLQATPGHIPTAPTKTPADCDELSAATAVISSSRTLSCADCAGMNAWLLCLFVCTLCLILLVINVI